MSTADPGGIIADNSLNNLFPNVTGPQSTNGAVHHRCIYINNTNGAGLALTNPKIWISQDTASTNDEVDIGLDPAGVGQDSSVDPIPNETDTGTNTPTGVTYATGGSRPTSLATAITLEDIPAGSKRAFWIRRTVQAGAAAFTNNSFQLQVSGETLD